MKKIALILALVMVFAVALVACDETPAESTPVTNESTPADESTPVDESEPADESVPADESEPADESDEEPAGPEASENDPTLSFAGTNIALGLTVLNQDNIDSSITTLWIDTDLTDGVIETEFTDAGIKWTSGQWFGYYNWPSSSEFTNSIDGVASPTIDLGASKTIYGARANVYTGPGWSGVCAPVSGELLVSDDGENWTSVGKVNVTAGTENGVTWVAVAAPEGTTAQYVRLALQHSEAGAWMFIDELEVYGE